MPSNWPTSAPAAPQVRVLGEKLLAAGPDKLTPAERMAVMADQRVMVWLHQQAWLRPAKRSRRGGGPPSVGIAGRMSCDATAGQSQQFQHALQFRVRVVKMRREADVILSLAVGAQRGDDAGFRQFFVQRRQIFARLEK